MATKKETKPSVARENDTQVQELLEQRQEIAGALRESTSRAQAETALGAITSTDEATQLALLKALAKKHDVDAADVLLAINELTPNKAVRKESRRGLIHLAGAKIYPSWTPQPEAGTPLGTSSAPRFWKGYVTPLREEGEIQLILCWEQGFEYGEARMMAFLLDYWQDGVKDFFTEVGSKRRIDTRVNELNASFTEYTKGKFKTTDCTLAEGRRLILEALSVNQWRGTAPHKDYRHNRPLVEQMVLHAQGVGEDRGYTFTSPDLEPDEVVGDFAGGWSMGDYGLCYDLLAKNSPILEGLSRDEWIEQRRKWAEEAHPARFQLTFLREREHNQQSLWLPTTFLSDLSATRQEVEMAWSLELADTPLSGTLPEMPMGTIVYKETGRHWFWTSYTLVQEDGVWRIQRMTDEGARVQGLPIAEVQERLKEQQDGIQEITQNHSPTDPDAQQYYEEIVWRTTKALYYDDALLVKLPFDHSVYEDAVSRAMVIGATERAAAYLEKWLQRTSNQIERGRLLLRLGAVQSAVGDRYNEIGMDERAERFYALAESSLRESLQADNTVLGHILLAELLARKEASDEAVAELQAAQALEPTREEEAQIEHDLGNIALERKAYDEALRHFQRVAEINPNFEGIWFTIAHTYRLQNNFPEAEVYYRRAIEAEPRDVRAYSEMGAMYLNRFQLNEAQEIVEKGLAAIPDSAHLRALLAGILADKGERRRAQAVLAEAERINPRLEIVQAVREILNTLPGKKR